MNIKFNPLVSICIITYNREDFIKESIFSALNQTYKNIEILVIDDGSTDNTKKIVEEITDKRIKYFYKIHSGAPDTRNFAISKCSGEFISWLDSDDILLSTTIFSHIEYYKSYPDADLIYGNILVIDKFKNLVQKIIYSDWYKNDTGLLTEIITKNPIPNIGTIIKKSAYNKVGLFNIEFKRAHDYEWLSRAIGRLNFKYNNIDTLLWRQHGNNLGAGNINGVDYTYELKIILKLTSEYELKYLFPECFSDKEDYKNNAKALLNLSSIIAGYGFYEVAIEFAKKANKIDPNKEIEDFINKLNNSISKKQFTEQSKKISVTFLINGILGVTGGNQTLLQLCNELVRKNYEVNIITYSDQPEWFGLLANHIKVPENQPMFKYTPQSDYVISTYFLNTHELTNLNAKYKIYYAQGDQFVFDERQPDLPPDQMEVFETFKLLSVSSYLHKNINIIANSNNLANVIKQKYNTDVYGILPVGIDTETYNTNIPKRVKDKLNILIVGPDVLGNPIEPLDFKGIQDIKNALINFSNLYNYFSITRISNSEKYFFNNIDCEFIIRPTNKQKQEIFNNADILIYASHYDSCPLPPLEAMTAGVAVICTDTAGAKEYCINEYNSLLVPVKRPDKIAEALSRLYDNKELRQKIITGGIETAVNFSFDKMVQRFEKILYSLNNNNI